MLFGAVVATMASLLASLSLAGVVQRRAGDRFLRVAPRFLAHVEGMALTRPEADPLDVLRAALETWDEYRHDTENGARFLLRILEDRHQMGLLRPVFPPLEAFVAAA